MTAIPGNIAAFFTEPTPGAWLDEATQRVPELLLDHANCELKAASTALGFLYFSREKVDIAVIEVGLGGRLDATNIITPLLSVITPIYLEHTYVLGDTISLIAAEKGGIIKPGVPVVIAAQSE